MRCVSSCPLVFSGESFVWGSLLLYSCQLDVMSHKFECKPVSQYIAKNKKEWRRTNTSENVKTFGFKPQRKLLPNLPRSSYVLAYDHMNVWKSLIKTERITTVYRKDSVLIRKNFLLKITTPLNKTGQNSVVNAGLIWLWKRPVVIKLVSPWHFLTLQIQVACFLSFFHNLFSLYLPLVIENNSLLK